MLKQEILIKTQENNTGDVLSCYTQQSSIHYTLLSAYIHSFTQCIGIIHIQIRHASTDVDTDMQKYKSHDKTSLYTTLTV